MKAVQGHLVDLGLYWLDLDGAVEPIPVKMIRLFQALENGGHMVALAHYDGEVEEGGYTQY